MALDFSPTTQDALSLLVQRYNAGLPADKQITNDTDFLLSGPLAAKSMQVPNTEVQVTIKAGTGGRGRIHIRYNRFALEGAAAIRLGWDETVTTLHALLPQINQAFGLKIQESDVDNVAITQSTASLTVKPSCYRYTGTLTFGPSSIVSLQTALPVSELDGFNLP